MRRNQHTVEISVLSDPLQLGNSSNVAWVGADNANCSRLNELAKVLAQVDLLAGVDRRRGGAGNLAVEVGGDVRRVVAGHHILQPHDVVRLDGARKSDGVRHGHAWPTVE